MFRCKVPLNMVTFCAAPGETLLLLLFVEEEVGRFLPLVTDRFTGCHCDFAVVVGEPAICRVTWAPLSVSAIANVMA